jgi:hypothetical protein
MRRWALHDNVIFKNKKCIWLEENGGWKVGEGEKGRERPRHERGNLRIL